MQCFLINPSVNKISHDQSTNINADKKDFENCQYSVKMKTFKHLGLEFGSWIYTSVCVYIQCMLSVYIYIFCIHVCIYIRIHAYKKYTCHVIVSLTDCMHV